MTVAVVILWSGHYDSSSGDTMVRTLGQLQDVVMVRTL